MRRNLFGLLMFIAIVGGVVGIILSASNTLGVALLLFALLAAALARIVQAGLLAEEAAVLREEERERKS